MNSPYSNLPASSFWKTGVAAHSNTTISELYRKKFEITPATRVATAGSCFAQHIANALRAKGFTVIDEEPPPKGLPPEIATRFGYRLYSARHGNIYTVRQLLQLLMEALGERSPDPVWEKDGRFYDALRPGVEPNGLGSPDEVRLHRQSHLRKFLEVIKNADLFVFTFGLTEAWVDQRDGTVYPTAPGTIAGVFDPDVFKFKNFTFNEVYTDFLSFREIVRRLNPGIRFLVTVSPVPLTATASGQHVLAATVKSKSILRAVAGQLYDEFPDVDYVPSFELISTPFLGSSLFEENRRSVSKEGVASVMRIFFEQHQAGAPVVNSRRKKKKGARRRAAQRRSGKDVVCEEALLEAFGKK